jgi:hypothetical protein
VRRENEYSGAGDGFENLTGGFQTIEQRHRDVNDDHCGTKFFDQGDGPTAVFRFADHFEITFQLQHLAKPLPCGLTPDMTWRMAPSFPPASIP